jgi:hypothetical protein
VPPARRFGARLDRAAFRAGAPERVAFFRVRRGAGRDEAAVFARRFLPLGVFAPAARGEPGRAGLRPVFRPAPDVRRAPAPLRAAARAPDPARLFAGVFFRPFAEPFLEEPAALRFAAFLAIVC